MLDINRALAAAALRRRFDLDDLLLFETTLATHTPPASFSQAMAAARRQLDEGAEARFEMAVDVRRARMQRVRPLAVTVGGVDPHEGEPVRVTEALEAAPALPAFDVEIAQSADTPGDRIRQWQRKLLNLTTSNRLLHVPDSAKVLKLMCPDPGALEDLLASGRKVRVVPMPDLETGGRDARLFEQQTQTNLREEVAKAALARGEALSLLGKDKLDALLIELFRKTDSLQDWFLMAQTRGTAALEQFILDSMLAEEGKVKAAGLSAGGRRPLRYWRPPGTIGREASDGFDTSDGVGDDE
ncbi:hypothetical protein HMP09_0284 [Sphingomonas sp. HMP9]|uniref:DUF4011 domain-containing protein n=1 Tax=Sphingomonas sp. HMP9 TaxID=1517554 RepID=UPI00159AC7FA|nr:DUF4011 domain-containing protein [Sphingomonas sp. HMP9]BCA61050.1 hypothetical protein HMP09_0284 [Sphingomonas sp. HMP9]